MKKILKVIPMLLLLPICEQLVVLLNSANELICSHIEYHTDKVKLKIAELNLQEQEITGETNTQAIGFTISNDEEDYEEEDW